MARVRMLSLALLLVALCALVSSPLCASASRWAAHNLHSRASPPHTFILEGPNEPSAGCPPEQQLQGRRDGAGEGASRFDVQHLALSTVVEHDDDEAAPPSFLFRGASPLLDNFAGDHEHRIPVAEFKSTFLYSDLMRGLRRVAQSSNLSGADSFPDSDDDVFLIDYSLLRLSRTSDAARIQAEHDYFRDHSSAGQFLLRQTAGTSRNVSEEVFASLPDDDAPHRQVSHHARLARELLEGKPPEDWTAPDDLIRRVKELTKLLKHKRVRGANGKLKTIAVYVHCYCGADRSGEMMGAFEMHHNRLNWKEVNALNHRIAGRAMGCAPYLAMQWYCLYESGQQQRRMGCMKNYPCTIFETPSFVKT